MSDYQYQVTFVCPIDDWSDVCQWANTNIYASCLNPNNPATLGPGGVWPPTHAGSNGVWTVSETTLLIAYLRGKDRVNYSLPEGWEEMNKAQRLAAIDDDEDTAIAANGILSVLTDNQAQIDPYIVFGRIDTTGLSHANAGQDLDACYPPEEE